MITRTTRFPDGKGKTEDVSEIDVGEGIANLVHAVAYQRVVIEKRDGSVVEYRRSEEDELALSPEELLAEHGVRGVPSPPPVRRGLEEALEAAFREAEVEGWLTITGGGVDDLAATAVDAIRQAIDPEMLVMAAAGLLLECRQWRDDETFIDRSLAHLRAVMPLLPRGVRDGTR